MVVHTPTKLDALRQTAAERRAAGDAGTVPPSVAAAAAAAAVDQVGGTAAPGASGVPTGTLLEDLPDRPADDPRELAAGNGIAPPSIEVDAAREQEQHVDANVTVRRVKNRGEQLTPEAHVEDDKISIAGSTHEAPPSTAGDLPQLNPFTPEWFAQLVGAAASAAASAAVQAVKSSAPATPTTSTVTSSAAISRRLNERKIPDFWEDKPDFWFRIFDAHLAHFSPTEMKCFDALLPLLTPAARSMVHALIRTPGPTPYSKARQVLLRHFGRTPHQLAREFRDTRSLGDRLPSELVDHLQSLLPDVNALYEVMLLDSLPPNARDAALQHSGLAAMSAAADQVVLGNRAAAASESAVASLSVNAASVDTSLPPPCCHDHLQSVSAVSRGPGPRPRKPDLCQVHARYGKKAFKCAAPASCKMQHVICPRPPSATPAASGNGNAGGQ